MTYGWQATRRLVDDVKSSATRLFQSVTIATAVALAVLTRWPDAIERYYARGVYPAIQSALTSSSNRFPIALFDGALIVVVGTVVFVWFRTVALARRQRSLRPIGRGLAITVTMTALVYIWFLLAWGLNYARPPLETVLRYESSRITPLAVRQLAEHAVAKANHTHAAAHAAGFPQVLDVPPSLAAALSQVERDFGRPRSTVLARPKRSLLSPFFRASGVSGMLAPFFLETLLNPDLTPAERPAVLAHEWAHLAGYAPESDASFIGFLAALRAGPSAEYSAWLELVSEAVNQLQPVTQRLVLENLGPGPRADQEAIRERLKALVRPVERVAWSTYDQMLKSQGVEEGVRSYSRVIQLLLGTDVLGLGLPRDER